jgi:hypothetical protein
MTVAVAGGYGVAGAAGGDLIGAVAEGHGVVATGAEGKLIGAVADSDRVVAYPVIGNNIIVIRRIPDKCLITGQGD